MDDALGLWREWEEKRTSFEKHQHEVFAPVREQIERLVEEQQRKAQGAIQQQKALLSRLRRQLAKDARALLPTDAFKSWLALLLKPAQRGKTPTLVPPDVTDWELSSQPLPLGLHGVEQLEQQGYNDEEHFLSSLLVVEATLGDERFFIGFETSRAFVLGRRERTDLVEQIEYTAYEIEDKKDKTPPTLWGRRRAWRPTWRTIKNHKEHDLGLQIFALARFAVPMLEAAPSQVAFSYP